MDTNAKASSSKSAKRKRQPPTGAPVSPSEHGDSPAPKSKKICKPPPTLGYPILDVDHLTDSAQGRQRTSAETTQKVGIHLHNLHLKLLSRQETVMRMLSDRSLEPSERIKALVAWYCQVEEVAPPTDDPLLWELVEKVSHMLCSLATSPNEFNPLAWPGILSPTTDTALSTSTSQILYYIRAYRRPRRTAQTEFEEYMQQHPIDAAFSTSRMAMSGMAKQASNTLKDVIRVCGFEGAEFEVEDVKDSPLTPHIQEFYGGQTSRTAEKRKEEDDASGGVSRNTNFSLVADSTAMKCFIVVPWTLETNDPLDWRRRPLLRDLERILVLSLPSPLNSASGGGPPLHRPPQQIRHRFERVLANLPEKVISIPSPELSEKLNSQLNTEKVFLQAMRNDGHDVGPVISERALAGVKGDLCERVETVNNQMVCIHIWKDIPAEVFEGRIAGGFYSEEMGRSAYLQWDMSREIHAMDGIILSLGDRHRLGPLLDLWRLILRHRWWGLMVIMLEILLETMRPLIVLGHSSPVAHLFIGHLIAQLPHDVKNHGQLNLQILQNPRIKSLMAPPNFPTFLDHIGDLRIVSTGPHTHQLALFLGDVHLGRMFYQPTLMHSRLRVRFAIAFKGYVLQRVMAHLVSTSPPIKDAPSRRSLLERAKARVEELLEAEGLETQLAEWITLMRLEESADTALRGKHVVHGELVRENAGKARSYTGRDIGSTAQGKKHSPERLKQLENFRSTAATARQNGQSPFTGPQGSAPDSDIFADWLLSRGEGVSLLWSANRYGRSPEAFKATQDENQRLALFNKHEALKKRRADADRYGGHRRAVLLRRFEVAAADALRGRRTNFADATRAVICTKCGDPDIGIGQNSQHRCRIEDEKKDGFAMIIGARQISPQTKHYLRILFLRDLIDFPRIRDFVVESDYREMGIYSVCAKDYLVDDNGEPLASLPPGLDLDALEDSIVWRREDTSPRMLLASALDVALREMAEKHDRESNEVKLMAGSIYAREQDKLWGGKFSGSIIEAIEANPLCVKVAIHLKEDCNVVVVRNHTVTQYTQMRHGCQRGKKLETSASEYQFIEASRFVDLPYVLTRFCVYKALVQDDDDFKRVLMWG